MNKEKEFCCTFPNCKRKFSNAWGLFLHGRKDKLHNIGSNKRPISPNGNNLNKFERKVQQKAAVDEDILKSMFVADEKISTTNFDEIAKQMEEEYMSGDEEENENNLANFIEETNSDDNNDANIVDNEPNVDVDESKMDEKNESMNSINENCSKNYNSEYFKYQHKLYLEIIST